MRKVEAEEDDEDDEDDEEMIQIEEKPKVDRTPRCDRYDSDGVHICALMNVRKLPGGGGAAAPGLTVPVNHYGGPRNQHAL
ncbi:hypothetical protein PG988_011113 [Apiospora saccharicola]